MPLAASFALFVGMSAAAYADVHLPKIFSDHAVIQSDVPAPIWGSADPDEKITIQIGDAKASAVAGKDGKWLTTVGPLKSGEPFEMVVSGAKNSIKVHDVVAGEVWLCSGQSNMGMPVSAAQNFDKEAEQANHPLIRQFSVGSAASDTEQDEERFGQWIVCSPKRVGGFSATAYFFARDLNEAIHKPVGVINASWGGTRIEPWISPAALLSCPLIADHYTKWIAQPIVPKEEEDAYQKATVKWRAEMDVAQKEKKPAPPRPAHPRGRLPNEPGYGRLYNAMIHPLIPYSIRGAVWYQGESNGGEGKDYRTLLPLLIGDWRSHWNQPGERKQFPFLVVQLPNNGDKRENPTAASTGWTLLREAQRETAANTANVGLAVTIDTCANGDIHPIEKQPVGRRLALIAERRVYGMSDVIDCGPIMEGTEAEGASVRFVFKASNGPLVLKSDERPSFYMAGEDRKFYPATATLDGQRVVVHCDKVAKPVAVRYGWAQNPAAVLFNASGLPAAPFRTDAWDQ